MSTQWKGKAKVGDQHARTTTDLVTFTIKDDMFWDEGRHHRCNHEAVVFANQIRRQGDKGCDEKERSPSQGRFPQGHSREAVSCNTTGELEETKSINMLNGGPEKGEGREIYRRRETIGFITVRMETARYLVQHISALQQLFDCYVFLFLSNEWEFN